MPQQVRVDGYVQPDEPLPAGVDLFGVVPTPWGDALGSHEPDGPKLFVWTNLAWMKGFLVMARLPFQARVLQRCELDRLRRNHRSVGLYIPLGVNPLPFVWTVRARADDDPKLKADGWLAARLGDDSTLLVIRSPGAPLTVHLDRRLERDDVPVAGRQLAERLWMHPTR